MPYNKLSTTKIAQAVGCHPNTVRMYEEWGFLPPVPRSRAGYRLFKEAHLDQMRLARLALNAPWAGRPIRQSSIKIIQQAAAGDLGGALETAYQHLALVRSELSQAHTAVELLERWAQGAPTDISHPPLNIRAAARLLELTTDTLRNWERNGLIVAPRNPANRYREFGQKEIARLRVIRMLRNAGYSLMAILRMLLQLDAGLNPDLRQALDTPREDEDLITAGDRWITTLQDQEQRTKDLIALLEERIRKGQTY